MSLPFEGDSSDQNVPGVTGVNIAPAADPIYPGSTTTITINLTDSAPRDGLTITIGNTNPQLVQVPSSVVAEPGSRSTQFNAQAQNNVSGQTVITASLPGSPPDVVSTTLTVVRPAPFAVIFSPAAIFSGDTAEGTVTLNAPAPVGMPPVQLSSDVPGVAKPPATLPVLTNATSAKFTVVGGEVQVETVATITATLSGVNASGPLIIRPRPLLTPVLGDIQNRFV